MLQNVEVRVENWSSFDKSNFNALTAPLGAIVPLKKQLLIPGKFKLSVKLAASLPPLATDAFLRTHLKVECFTVPIRLCSGSFESWFAGVKVATWNEEAGHYSEGKAYLPRLGVVSASNSAVSSDATRRLSQKISNALYGPHSLLDYLGIRKRLVDNGSGDVDLQYLAYGEGTSSRTELYNLIPIIAYNLCYDHWYRNKLLQRPVFVRPQHNSSGFGQQAAFIPFEAYGSIKTFEILNEVQYESAGTYIPANLRQKRLLTFDERSLLELRYRNYGDDYFTSAMPSAQLGSPVTIDSSAGYFSVAALREGNVLQHFAEINQVAGPDFVQANKARYGVDVSMGVAQRPILHGSADFPMFTSGVEQTSMEGEYSSSNPFETVGARYGRAHAEGNDFVCEVEVKEPSYLLVLCSLVPEANYSCGVDKDMRRFTHDGSIADLPCAALEGTGFEPIRQEEIDGIEQTENDIFGYQPQYTYHKLGGSGNEVHGLFRRGASLSMFIPQRSVSIGAQLGSAFLIVQPTDLDSVMAVSGDLSKYGVMIDSAIDLRVSEPLSESRLPSLVNPAEEHGKSLYIHKGGIRV